MGRVQNNCLQPRRVAFVWILCIFLFLCAFQMLLNNSSFPGSTTNSNSDALLSSAEQRARLYDKMARDLSEHGPAFLRHGKTSQSLSLSDLFIVKDGLVTPNPMPANPPVRANVLHLSTEYSIPVSDAVKDVFSPYFDKAIWFQNSSLYHFSMFHASHHISPVPATSFEIDVEANAVKSVVQALCPLKIVLDRVLLTSTGVLLGCWQVTAGADPATIRSKLKSALPRAPERQLYDVAILHTSFARLLGPPRNSERELDKASDNVQILHELVARLNNKIRGFQAIVSELWYVEEFDVLALAADGRMKIRRFQLECLGA